MLSLVNKQFKNLEQMLSQTEGETKALKQTVVNTPFLELQHNHSFPQKTCEFLDIHQKIESFPKSNQFLNKIKKIAGHYEKIILQTLNKASFQNPKEIEKLCKKLNRLKDDPLLKNGKDSLSKSLYADLEKLSEAMCAVAKHYKEIAYVQEKMEFCEKESDEAIANMAAEEEAWEKGGTNFRLTNDFSVVDVTHQFIQLYRQYQDEDSLPLFHAEFLAKLTWQLSAIRFHREDYCREYQAAVEVEVLKTLQAIHQESNRAEEQYDNLLETLEATKKGMQRAKDVLGKPFEGEPNEKTEKLFKEFRLILEQLDRDLKFLEKQISILEGRQPVGLWGKWTIYSRERRIAHHVRRINEAEEDKPIGWGRKLLHMGVWGLYLSPQISSLVQFAKLAHQAVTTGQSPELKQAADEMSDMAFAKKAHELPIAEQQEVDGDINIIQGVLNGYIPFTENFAQENHSVAKYLETIPKNEGNQNCLLDVEANNPIPIPILSTQEANYHAMRYLGQQVREHYHEAGKVLEWQNPQGSLSWDQSLAVAFEEQKPKTIFAILGEGCVEAIREAKAGVPIEENVKFQELQEHAVKFFGTKIPEEWFEGWLVRQEWNETRLDDFQGWLTHNLEVQTRNFITHRQYTSTQNKEAIVIEDLSDHIYPGHSLLYEAQAASQDSTLTPHMHQAVEVYRYFVNQVRQFFNLPSYSSDFSFLHQLGDFFGQNTGLEGYSHLEALKFQRDLLYELIKQEGNSPQLQLMVEKLEQAIMLSKGIYKDVNTFRKMLNEALTPLKPSESVYLTGGWVTTSGGHAMIYEVIRQSNDLFTFRIYNTGGGTEHHIFEIPEYKEKIVPYVEIAELSLEKILERPFLNAMQKIKTSVLQKGESWNADDIYYGLIRDLKSGNHVVRYGYEDLMTPQRSGTCSFRSLDAFFYQSHLDKNVSLRTRFKLLSNGISNYVYWNENRLGSSSQVLNLFSKGLEEYSRITTDMYEKGVINDQELKEANDKIKGFRKKLLKAQQQQKRAIQDSRNEINFNQRSQFWDKKISLPDDLLIDPKLITPSQNVPLTYLSNLKDWQPKQETIIEDLNSFIGVLKKGASEGAHLSVLLEIQKLVPKLNLTEMNFSKEEMSKVISQLHTLAFMFYENIQRSCQQHPETHCQVISPKMVLTLNDVAYQVFKLFEKFYPIMAKELNLYFFQTSLTDFRMRFMDPEADETFLKLFKNSDIFFYDSYAGFISLPRFNNNEKNNLDKYWLKNETHFPNNIREEDYPKFSFFDRYIVKGLDGNSEYYHKRLDFPSEFYHLYDLNVLLIGLDKLPISLTSLTNKENFHIETVYMDGSLIDSRWRFNGAIFHPVNLIDNEYPAEFENKELALYPYDGFTFPYHLQKIYPEFKNGWFRSIIDKGGISENYLILHTKKDFLNFTMESHRALIRLETKDELKIKETLSYFTRRPELLVNAEYQAYFSYLLFAPGFLVKDLKSKNGFLIAQALASLAVKNYHFYKNIGDLKTASFFLKLNRLFKVYVDYAKVSPSPEFLHTQEEIKKLLAKDNLSEETRWFLNQELALSFFTNQNLTDKEAEEALTAIFYSNTYSSKDYYDEKWNQFQIEEFLQKHVDAFIKLSTGSEKNRILNLLAAISTGDSIEKEWRADPAYPYFITTDGTYKIDLESCTASLADGDSLPSKVARHPDLIRIFKGNVPKKCTKIGVNAFQVTFEGNEYRILTVKNEVVIQREFNEQGKSVWGQHTKNNENIAALIPACFTKAFNVWVCGTNPTALVMTNQAHQIVARLVERKIYQVNPLTNENTGFILDDYESSSLYETFSGFEDKNYFYIWIDENSWRPQQITFPRLGLEGITFRRQKVGDKDRMVSEAFSGYYLAEKHYVAEMQDDFSFLLLENSAGDKQVILPKLFYKMGMQSKKEEKQSLDTSKNYFNQKLDSPHLLQHDFYQYKVNPKTGELEASTLEAKLYLSMRHLWMMRYEKAENLLRGYDTLLRPYTAREVDVLMQIVNLSDISGDQDPRATSISLYAAYLLDKNSRNFGIDLPKKLGIDNLYSTYLNQLNNIYAIRLKTEEELLLLTTLPNKNQAMINRLIALDPEKGRKAQAQLSLQMELFPKKINEKSFGLIEEIENFFPENSILKSILKSTPSDSDDKDESISMPPLRQNFNFKRFQSVYQFLQTVTTRHALTNEQKQFFELFTGLDFSAESWRQELASSLRFMTSTPNQQSNTLAWILLAFFEHPKKINLKAFLNEKTSQDFYKNTLVPQLHALYPELTKKLSPSFARMEKVTEGPISSAEKQKDLMATDYQHCLALNSILTFPVVEKFNGLGVQQTRKTNEQTGLVDLKRAFRNISTTDPIVNSMMNRVVTSIDLYQDASVNGEGDYSLSSLKDLNLYADKISEAINGVEKTLREHEMDLLRQVNRPSTDPIIKAKEEILAIGQSRQPLTVDDLVYLYWNRDAELFHQKNPHLSVEEIHQLTSDIQNMLIQATHVQQLKRILSQIDLIRKNLGSSELSDHLKLLKSYIDAKHAYEIDQHPEYLVLEYYADILLFPEQLKSLDLLQIRDGKIRDRQHLGTALEMIMGSGKTYVLMPLLGILNADGDTLSIGVLPSALLPSMAETLAKTLGTSFKKVVEVVTVNRDTPFDEEFLVRIQNIRRGKKLMLMDDSSVESFYLSFIEHLYTFSHATKEERLKMEAQRQIFIEIFTLMKEHSSVIIDEIDQILNPRTEKQYTLGSSTSMPIHEMNLIAAFYEILETEPSIYSALHFEYSDLSVCSIEEQEERNALIEKAYENVVKPKLVNLIIQRMMDDNNVELQQFFSNLTKEQMGIVKDYLTTQSTSSTEFVRQQTPLIKDLLALAKEEIQDLLLLTCVKISHQNYGPSHKEDFAIPYHGSDVPSLKSQFGTPYETMHYSIQLAIKDGINRRLIERYLIILRNQVTQELKDDPHKKLESTRGHQAFMQLVKGDQTLDLFGSEAMLDKICDKVNSDLNLKLQFVKDFIAPQIKNYELSMSANPQIYNFLFSILNGFSGTQWNADTFPEKLKVIQDEIITGKTLALLWKNRHEPIHVIKPRSGRKIINELIANNPQAKNANALIDTAGMIRGIKRLEIAKELLNAFTYSRPDIKGIVFYDEENNLLILEKGKLEPIPLLNSKLLPEERFTFYDQKHTSGSDIKQIPAAKAILTIGKDTILRDLLQSVWRFRGLDKSQQMMFAIDSEVKDLILNVMQKLEVEAKEPLQLEHLLLFVSYNQAMLQGDNNYRSLKQKTWAILQEEAFKAFLDPTLDGEQVAKLFASVEHLFVQKNSISAWDLFGESTDLVDGDVAAKIQGEKVKNSPAFDALSKRQDLSKEVDDLVEKTIPLLSSKITTSHSTYNREVEAEKEKEIEKETEKESEVEISDKEYSANRKLKFKVLTLKEVFAQTKSIESFADLFDPGLFGSLNLLPIPKYIPEFRTVDNSPPFGVFNQYQKNICALKIVSEDEIVMVDQIDIDREKGTFYDLNIGLFQIQGEIPTFLKSEKFMRKVIQAKFFNGESHYSKEELPLLKEWIKEKGVPRMKELFVNHILKFKEDSRAAFSKSILERELS